MTPRPRRMVPGMLVSLLLATPLAATPAFADTHHGATLKPVEHHRRAAQRHKQQAARRRATPAPAPQMVTFFDDSPPGWYQTGIASWYGGPRWQGRRTASGTRFEQDDLTAAHATLPLGTRVRVALAGSDRSVVVTINDRPGTHSRIIDLSRGAARALGILDRGIAEVTLSTP